MYWSKLVRAGSKHKQSKRLGPDRSGKRCGSGSLGLVQPTMILDQYGPLRTTYGQLRITADHHGRLLTTSDRLRTPTKHCEPLPTIVDHLRSTADHIRTTTDHYHYEAPWTTYGPPTNCCGPLRTTTYQFLSILKRCESFWSRFKLLRAIFGTTLTHWELS